MPAYQDPGSSLLRQHLPHRDGSELAAAAGRLGWASWEDCNAVAPGACPWLTATPVPGEVRPGSVPSVPWPLAA